MQRNHDPLIGARRRRFAALLIAAAPLALAQQQPPAGEAEAKKPPRYTVEIILFRYGDGVASGGEVFPPDEPQPSEEQRPELALEPVEPGEGAGEQPIPEFGDRVPAAERPAADTGLEEAANLELKLLPPEARTLRAEYRKLEELDAYQPVLWAGWTQATYEENVTPAIRLRRLGAAPVSFDGAIELYQSRFLHLVVDLSLQAPQSAAAVPRYGDDRFAAPAVEAPVHYRIQEDRIVKNGDLRYFDHPKFGLLAKVTRVEAQDSAAGSSGAPATP